MVLISLGQHILPLRMYDGMYAAPAHGKAIYIWIGATSMDDPWG